MSSESTKPNRSLTDEERVRELGLKNNLKQAEVNTLIEYYKRKDPHNQGLLPQQFKEAVGEFIASGLTIDPNIIFNIFNTAESGVQGRVSIREFILGYAILCRGTTENRLRYLFAIYGADGPGFLTRDQLIRSLKLMQRIVSEVSLDPDETDTEENEEHIRQVADNLIADSSWPETNTISYDDFIEKVKEEDVVMSWLEKLSDVAGQHFKYIEKLELEVVQLNMEREGILTSGPRVDGLQQSMDWSSSAAQVTDPLSQKQQPNPRTDKKRKIPAPRQKLVRRDLREQRTTSGSSINRFFVSDECDDAGMTAAKPFLINYHQIKFGRILGRGACATVYEGTWMHIPVAVKVFNDGSGEAASMERLSTLDEEIRKTIVGDYVEEFWLLLQIRHPNCLLYMGICFEPVVCIVTELFTGGSVASFLHGPNARKFLPTKAIEMICCVARGMYYLHASTPPILHRDLKASNILINRLVSHCVICDFGLSSQFVSEASGLSADGSRFNPDDGRVSGVGTPYTMAPEVMQRQPYTPAADVYSFGVVMYEMYTSRFPYPKLKPGQLMYSVSAGQRPNFFEEDNVPPTLRALIERCWAHEPKDRPTFEDILKELTSPKLIAEVDAAETALSEKVNGRACKFRKYDELSKRLLEEAFLGRDAEVLKLINQGVNVNYCDYDKRTALHVAAAEGHVSCMRVLIRAGAQLCYDRWNNTALVDAINYANRSGDSEPVRVLRAIESRSLCGATSATTKTMELDSNQINVIRRYRAMNAAARGDVTTVSQMLYEGLDVNMYDYDRRTPLMVAASEGKREVVDVLLQHGANIRRRDRWGSTAYHEAERGGHHDVMLVLRQAEEHFEQQHNPGTEPHLANN